MVVVFLLSSCATSYKTVYIEVAKPSKDMLPDSIVTLALMNRSVTSDFQDYPADSLQIYFYDNEFDVNAVLLDSLVADTTLKALGQLLYESGRYQVVIPKNRNIPRESKYYKVAEPLSWDYVRRICDLYHTDALLVIERYMDKIKTHYDQYQDSHYASIDSKYNAFVRIYDPKSETILRQISVDDTIYWSQQSYSQRDLFLHRLVSVKKALIETGIQTAIDLDDKISPQWQTESRGYFQIKDANSDSLESYINNNDWQAAFDYWKKLYDQNHGKSLKSKLEYNMAVASEMIGDFDGAADWAKKSYLTQYRQQTENYLYTLKRRIKVIDQFKEISN
ncbi:MAG TPA: DUF6340 family protein [Sunxiuqinia sp.]|nr:DUF6340 family protein [Sunxiuqinia sp.]